MIYHIILVTNRNLQEHLSSSSFGIYFSLTWSQKSVTSVLLSQVSPVTKRVSQLSMSQLSVSQLSLSQLSVSQLSQNRQINCQFFLQLHNWTFFITFISQVVGKKQSFFFLHFSQEKKIQFFQFFIFQYNIFKHTFCVHYFFLVKEIYFHGFEIEYNLVIY